MDKRTKRYIKLPDSPRIPTRPYIKEPSSRSRVIFIFNQNKYRARDNEEIRMPSSPKRNKNRKVHPWIFYGGDGEFNLHLRHRTSSSAVQFTNHQYRRREGVLRSIRCAIPDSWRGKLIYRLNEQFLRVFLLQFDVDFKKSKLGCGDGEEERIDWNRVTGESCAVDSGYEVRNVVALWIALFLREMAFCLEILGDAIEEQRGSFEEMV